VRLSFKRNFKGICGIAEKKKIALKLKKLAIKTSFFS
jgi:hypothetical protein